jgi:hypothetical protein
MEAKDPPSEPPGKKTNFFPAQLMSTAKTVMLTQHIAKIATIPPTVFLIIFDLFYLDLQE